VLASTEAGGKAIRGGVLRVAGYGGVLVLSLVSVPIMVRHLGVVDFGRYVSVTALVFIVAMFTEAGLTNLGIREYATRKGSDREALLRNLNGLRLVMTTVAVLGAVAFSAVTRSSTVIVAGTALAGVGLLLTLVQQTYAVPLSAELRLGWVTALELLKQATLTVLIVALVVVGAGLLPFFAAAVGSGLTVLAATLVLIRGRVSLRPRFELAVWRGLLADLLPYALATAVGVVYFRVAVVLLSYVGSEVETGIYSAAFRIVEVLVTVPFIVISAAFPILARAARDDAERLRYALQRLFEASAICGAGLALVIALGAPFAVAVIAGQGFEEAVVVLQVLGVALLTSFLATAGNFALLSLRAHRALVVNGGIAAVVVIVGVLALTPPLGATGAALATVAGEAAMVVANVVTLARHHRSLLPSPRVLPRVALAAAVGSAAALVPVAAVVQSALGGLLFVAAVVVLRAVPVELVLALRRRA
jgi:O-antigen/teichoic acid export membrane protein